MTPARSKPAVITVIIPVRDGEPFLAAAIESAMAQAGDFSVEVVVVDDGSRDESAAIIANRLRVRCIRQPAQGVAAAFNRGLSSTTGTFVAFLDSDDIMPQNGMAMRYAAIADDSSREIVFGRMVQFMDPSTPPEMRQRLRADPRPVPAQHAGTCLVRRAVFDRVGPFDTAPAAATFIDWVLRVRDAGVLLHEIDAVVLERRVHGSNLSLDRTKMVTGYLATLRRHFARQRTK